MYYSEKDGRRPPGTSSAAAGRKRGQSEVDNGRVRLVAISSKEAPLEENKQHVLLEITDTSSIVDRSGLDLVAVLDVSESMGWDGGTKLNSMKTAMNFVIGKLGPADRLSIVSFSDNAELKTPLVRMTEDTKEELKGIVNGLEAKGKTNMEEGLKAGLEFVPERQDRVCSIILMSDGRQDPGDATSVDIGDVAVYTFGFGADNDAKVLWTIASKSQGGTFSYVKDGENLSEHFSQILAGLLSVSVRDLKLTVWQSPGHSEILQVDAGDYRQTPMDQNGGITVTFGDLYAGEVRKVIVELKLPVTRWEYRAKILYAQCRYSVKGQGLRAPSGDYLTCSLRRTGTARLLNPEPEVMAELVRLHYKPKLLQASDELKDLRIGEDDQAEPVREKVRLAKRKLEEAKKDLENAERTIIIRSGSSRSTTTTVTILITEVTLLLRLNKPAELLACLLASWTSHQRQRPASRGDLTTVTIFRTQFMDTYLKQATGFQNNPNLKMQSVEGDIEMEKEQKAPPGIRRPPPVMIPDDQHRRPQLWIWQPWIRQSPPRPDDLGRRRRYILWAWRALIALCTVLAIALIVAGVAVFAAYLLYKPRTPYLVVSDARLAQLQYGQDGTIQYLQALITVLAENNNSKSDASFSRVDLALGFHGADVALLRAEPFVVPRRSTLPLRYDVVSAGQALDAAGVRAMDEALKAGEVPLDLFGKARTRWKVGVFHVKFWTRISCRLRFSFPGNGTVVMPTDNGKRLCRSRSP